LIDAGAATKRLATKDATYDIQFVGRQCISSHEQVHLEFFEVRKFFFVVTQNQVETLLKHVVLKHAS